MFNFRYTRRLLWAFIVRFKAVILIGIGFGLIFFLLLRFIIPAIFEHQEERIGITGRYDTSEIPNSVLNLIGMGLTKIDEKGVPQPALASSWQESDSGKTWTFHIRDGAKWQDGTDVVSVDIKYNFEDVEIKRPDKKTVVFKLSSAFSPFPTVVSKPVFKKGLLGTGEWKVADLSLAGTFVSSLKLINKNNDVRIYRFYPTEDKTKLAFKLGEVDRVMDLIDPKPFLTWKSIKVDTSINSNRYVAVFFNSSSESILADKDLRQALSYAIDKSKLGDFPRAYGPLSPNSWAYNSQTKPYDYDVDRAKDLFQKAKIDPAKRKGLSLKLSTTSTLLPVAEKIAKNWTDIGIPTTVQVTTSIPTDYEAFLAIYDIPSDPDQYSTWHSGQGLSNISHYQNVRIDKLLEDGRLELNSENRKKIYLDFQRFLVEDAPAAFLYHPASYTVKRR